MSAPPAILVIDDERAVLDGVRLTLRSHGLGPVLTCVDPRAALASLAAQEVGLVLLDLLMPHVGGEELLGSILARYPELPVVVVTADNDARAVVRCLELGAADYLHKPVAVELLVATVRRTLRAAACREESRRLRAAFFAGSSSREVVALAAELGVVAEAPATRRALSFVAAMARSSAPVLIHGEPGTGKRSFAQALHRLGGGPGRPDELDLGAVAPARAREVLRALAAEPRTHYLFDAARCDAAILEQLGALLAAGECGAARVVLGSSSSPEALPASLRRALDGRVVPLLPLRERPEDLLALLRRFAAEAAERLGAEPPDLPPEVLEEVAAAPLPGNASELRERVTGACGALAAGATPREAFRASFGARARFRPDGRDDR